jgi:formiminoglutamase
VFNQLNHYQSADPSLWQGRHDTTHPERFYQKVSIVNDEDELNAIEAKTAILGFASDAGVIRNLGRPGAHLGPYAIKTQLGKLPCHVNQSFIDLGTIVCEDDMLESSQNEFAYLIDYCHQKKYKTVAFGGGHEIALAHYMGLAKHYPKLGIINLDAHFDLRPHLDGQPGNSGTPFSEIAVFCEQQNRSFHYCCLGIQKLGNTASLFARANSLKVPYLSAEDMQLQSLAWQQAFVDEFLLNLDHVYLTICLDAFAESFAPGVSAPQPLGLIPTNVLPLLKYIVQSGKVVSFDIAELAPPLDVEQKTARLAAQIVAELLHN